MRCEYIIYVRFLLFSICKCFTTSTYNFNLSSLMMWFTVVYSRGQSPTCSNCINRIITTTLILCTYIWLVLTLKLNTFCRSPIPNLMSFRFSFIFDKTINSIDSGILYKGYILTYIYNSKWIWYKGKRRKYH